MRRMLRLVETSSLRFKTEWMKIERLMRRQKRTEENSEGKKLNSKRKKPRKAFQRLEREKLFWVMMMRKWKRMNNDL
jgi:hypothetical protein